MRTVKLLIVFCLALMLIGNYSATAQQKPNSVDYLSGYTKDIKGEVLGYHSPLPSVNSSLLVRSIAKQNYIEWETGAIPEDYKGNSASFVWMFGVQAKPETHKFDLFINDKYILSFNNPKDTVTRIWTIKGVDDVSLTFDATMVDVSSDLMGFACLTVPAVNYKKGAPLKIRIEGESATRNTWYMTFRHSIDNNIRAVPMSILIKDEPVNAQSAVVEIIHFSDRVKGKIKILNKEYDIELKKGFNKFNVTLPAAETERKVDVSFETANSISGKTVLVQKPVKPLTIYLLHHSHNDIGYTHIQQDVVKMQIKNLKDALESIEKTKNYPRNSRMKWNTEVIWPVLQYMRNSSRSDINTLKKAVKEGSIELNMLFGNMLTGLCRPEELMQAMEPGRKIAETFGVKSKTAMISDVPGLSWGIVPALASYGIKYLQIGENTGDRIGYSLATWGDKPFYWVGPSGKDKILCFTSGKGYSFFHTGLNYTKFANPIKEERISYYLDELDNEQYPYDIIPVHYTVGSDNGPVHTELPDIIKEWNKKYISPQILISTTSDFYQAFEKKYGETVPVLKGDYTGSWDDGAASTALETGMNRRSADRIAQAEALYSIVNPAKYNEKEFDDAWENVLLYSEHTWGSWNSMSDPENPFTKQQWAVKRSFAVKADSISKQLVNKIVPASGANADAVDVYNTSSWKRTGWVFIDNSSGMQGTAFVDENKKSVPAHTLQDGRVVLYAADVPALGSKRYYISGRITGMHASPMMLNKISNNNVSVEVDPRTGNIISLKLAGLDHNFVDTGNIPGLTDYQYVKGRRPDKYETASNVKISRANIGGVQSLKIISSAPGCNSLEKEIIIYDKMNKVDINITIDRKKVYDPEGIHIAFPFNIPGAFDYVNTAWATFRPEYEQLSGSCKNYFPVQRFVDVSNRKLGITLISIDAPMIEIGKIMTDANTYGWNKYIENSPLVYSYVMNNYWGTNYKAEQEGITRFSYSLYPHLRTDLSEIEIKAIEESQPMIAVPADKNIKNPKSLFSLSSGKVIVTSIKPCRDGKGYIVRLFNTSSQPLETTFLWGAFKASKMFITNPNEERVSKTNNPVELLPNDIITLRLEK